MKTKTKYYFMTIIAALTLNCNTVKALTPSPPPFSLSKVQADFVKDISYGPHERHIFDIFLPKTQYNNNVKVPLVVLVHGGGFNSGSKEKNYRRGGSRTITDLLSKGIAVAAINYPLLSKDNETEGVIKSLNGSKRAIQHLRRYASTFNIIPEKIIVMGSSAGASTALWLAFHDDMANLSSPDLTERESTRILAAVGTQTQATLDTVRWADIFSTYNTSLDAIAAQTVTNLYGITNLNQLNNPSVVLYRQNVDTLSLMDSSDPEVWIENKGKAVFPKNTSIMFHHPYHAKALRDQALAVNYQGIFKIRALNINDSNETQIDFILRKFQQ
jgi:hypothetical protein